MASLLERIQNVFDNHQDLERERVRQEGYQQALYQARDAMLGSALSLKNEWSNELAGSRSESHASVHARYEARIQGLNDAFTALRQSEPGITTQLHSDEFRESAARQAQARSYEAPELGRSSYQFAHAAGQQQDGSELRGGSLRPILNRDEYQAGYDYRKEALDRKLDTWHSAAHDSQATPPKEIERQAVRDIALQASQGVRDNWGDRGRGPERLEDPDFDLGQRKAIMDWSHQHNHRIALEQQRAIQQEVTREVHEYGISY